MAPLPTDRGDADGATFASKLAIGHQEIGRIVDEVDQIYSSQPTEGEANITVRAPYSI